MAQQTNGEKSPVEITGEELCRSADDFFRPHARATIYRLIPEFFTKNKVTVIETLHRAEMLGKLEDAGSYMQHAVQKIAQARSAAEGVPVQESIKILNTLIADLYNRVFSDKRDNVFPEVPAEKFGALATKLATVANGTYVLNGALAKHLRDGGNWNEKTVRLAKLAEMCSEPGAGRDFLLAAIDAFLAEILHMSTALQDLIGQKENFGEAMTALLQLFLGNEQSGQYGEGQGLARLARLFAAGLIPKAHRSLAERIVAEFYSLKRLRADSTDAEMKLFRRVVDMAQTCVGPHLTQEELSAALELRAARFLEPECLGASLAATVLPNEKVEWLFFAEGCIVGAQNKLKLFDTIQRLVISAPFTNQLHARQIPLMKRLHCLATMNALARRSGFAEDMRKKIANLLDIKALDLAAEARLFETIDAKSPDPAEKAVMIIKLFAAGSFTETRLAAKARQAVVGYVSRPGFLAAYVDQRLRASGDELDEAAAKVELAEHLKRIGVAPETCRQAVAA
jgi:hypothetical protein